MKHLLALIGLTVIAAHATAQSLPSGHPSVSAKKDANPASAAQLPQKGKVLSTLDAPPYAYIEVAQGKKTVWIAANAVPLKKGDTIRFDAGMPMTNFHSKTLNRTFPSVLFVNQVVVTKE